MKQTNHGLFDRHNEKDACGIGFIVDANGKQSHTIITDAVTALCNLEHRGAVGGDMKTGDGAGLLTQIPHLFFSRKTQAEGFILPPPGSYGIGFLFLPPTEKECTKARHFTEKIVRSEGAHILGWRQVPVNPGCLGDQAKAEMPAFWQIFIDFPHDRAGDEASNHLSMKIKSAQKTSHNQDNKVTWQSTETLERRLYILRNLLEQKARQAGWGHNHYYITSFSCRTIVYKGMFVSTQFFGFYPDLEEKDFCSAMALFHQRYSTNTFPSWFLAQPFRMIAHNGEINTLRRNLNNMHAREHNLQSPLFGDEIEKIKPVTDPNLSDSAAFDNVLELLIQGGREMPHALIMMVPEAFGNAYHISQDKRAFLEYHAAIMEPWDGPAAISFCDGFRVGALLDRNGLRPGRYIITKEGLVVLASETGVLDISPERVLEKGRLAPGKIFIVDTEQGRIIKDNEIKSKVSRRKPYRHWLEKNRIELKGLLGVSRPPAIDLKLRQQTAFAQPAFGYTRESMKTIIAPMMENAQEPVGSMGNDSALAVLSNKPQLLFNYFKQLFAQVTNPPIDPYRENLVMSLMSFLGRERNLLDETPEHCRQLKLAHPILTNDDMEMLRSAAIADYRITTVSILYAPQENTLQAALQRVCREAETCIDDGCSLVILSDRGISPERVAIPSLLTMGGVHHHLVRRRKRHLSGLILETGEAREVHHFATLIGYGASGINPYLVFESIPDLRDAGYISLSLTDQEAVERYITAVKKGLLKIMSKMGISTLRSYRGAQIFEAIGIGPELIEQCFTGTSSVIGGIGFAALEKERLSLHQEALDLLSGQSGYSNLPDLHLPDPQHQKQIHTQTTPNGSIYRLPSGGLYNQRQGSEKHLFSPETIILLQQATKNNDYALFKQYTAKVNDSSESLCTLRSLFDFIPKTAVPLEEVEPAEKIIRRFVSSAMSLGSISKEAHETIAVAMNKLGQRSNSGEGGEEKERFYSSCQNNTSNISNSEKNDSNSKIKQIASARFGVTSEYLVNAQELQIKMAQGAKPGEGGQLPGHKVDAIIARTRHSTPGVMLISPPPHHDIYSIEDLAQLIYDLKAANPQARVSVKLVSETGVGTVAAGVAKGKADTVLIAGGDGGTGASPLSSIMHTGSPWEIGLAETQAVLTAGNLRDKIRVQVDGQIKTGRDVVTAALLGAEEFGFATTLLVIMGCVMMRKCHLNTCPVGVATQDPELRLHFKGQSQWIINYFHFLAREVREIMAALGYRTFNEMIGQVDRITVNTTVGHYKTANLDFSRLLTKPQGHIFHSAEDFTSTPEQILPADQSYSTITDQKNLDTTIIRKAQALFNTTPYTNSNSTNRDRDTGPTQPQVYLKLPIKNSDRAVGATLSAEVSKKYRAQGLPDNSIHIKFTGSGGQSFAAFLAPGITFELEGDSNDYFCKGLSGGRVIIYPPGSSSYPPERNIIIGNVNLFGATSGEVFINGMAGERFCVRNSGATAVVEGVGDHGCEYMTGGRVIVLGETGINFAAGMSGGLAYVLDRSQLFDTRCNLEMVDVEPLTRDEDLAFVREYLEKHVTYTGSRNAKQALEGWEETAPLFVKVVPIDYKAALERLREQETKESESVNITEEVYR